MARRIIAVFLAFVSLGYMLPGAIAIYRDHKNTAAVCVLNLFTGFTGIGWIASLVWSFTN